MDQSGAGDHSEKPDVKQPLVLKLSNAVGKVCLLYSTVLGHWDVVFSVTAGVPAITVAGTRGRLSGSLRIARKPGSGQHKGDHRQRAAHVFFRAGQKLRLSSKDSPLLVEPRKHVSHFIGPCKITHKVTPVTYHLNLPHSLKISFTFHVSHLRPVWYFALAPTPKVPPPLRTIDGQATLTIHWLLHSHQVHGGVQYLVDWVGYASEERTGGHSGQTS